MARIHLALPIACLLALAVPQFFAEQAAEPPEPPQNLHLYLLIGGLSAHISDSGS